MRDNKNLHDGLNIYFANREIPKFATVQDVLVVPIQQGVLDCLK